MTELSSADVRDYYLKSGVLDKLFELCKEREVVPVFLETYGKRPSSVQFKGDLDYLVKDGATSFHCSVEHWKNPLNLSSNLRRSELDKIRTAWDLVIDIDSDKGLEYGKKAAILLIQALKMHGVKNISIKFSGRRGWHMAVHHKALPSVVNGKPVESQYPELLQTITAYLKSFVKARLQEQIGKLDSELKDKDPYETVHVEENWGSRHLFRAPYSFNEKTWLVSLPIELRQISSFKPEDASPENVKPTLGFLDKYEKDEAKDLILQSLDWWSKQSEAKELEKVQREYQKLKPEKALSEIYFPPCYRNIMKGIKDGRKRAVFIMINFLRSVGWEWPQIEAKLEEWNKNNTDPIKEVYISTQLHYAKKKNEIILPPNCDNKGYYKDIGVCTPDNFCARIKNPTSYALRKVRAESALKRKKR